MTAPGPPGPSPHAAPSGHGGGPGDQDGPGLRGGPAPHGVPGGPGAGYPVPAPPPGPGVVPPFAAPPTEGRTARLWIGLAVAALAVLLCCGVGTAAVVGLGVAGSKALNEQARATVGDYLAAVSDGKYDKAYDLLCDQAQERETPEEFEQRVTEEPEIKSYDVGDVRTDDLTVPAEVTYEGRGSDRLVFHLAQDSQTGMMEVCGIS